MTPFYGMYRGKVTDNEDPLIRGRIRAQVPAISDKPLTWAEPCTPYAGPKVGWYAIPPVGANVWIEFERGDSDYPIWSGCFWGCAPTGVTRGGPSSSAVCAPAQATRSVPCRPCSGGARVASRPPSMATPVARSTSCVWRWTVR